MLLEMNYGIKTPLRMQRYLTRTIHPVKPAWSKYGASMIKSSDMRQDRARLPKALGTHAGHKLT
jgi:hypothetical protein